MVKRTCREDGCPNPHVARGLCGKHYQRWRKANPAADLLRQHRRCEPSDDELVIPLTRGKTATADLLDLQLVEARTWHAQLRSDGKGWYAADAHGEPMHRVIMGLGKDDPQKVDHIDGDGLNNRRANLRTATHAQNMANRTSRFGSSRYKGVSWNKKAERWSAVLRFQDRSYYLGCFDDEEDAARAYDAKAVELHGEYALLNLPMAGDP